MAIGRNEILLPIEVQVAEHQAKGHPRHALPADPKPDASLDEIIPVLLHVEGRRLVGKVPDPNDQPALILVGRRGAGEGPGCIDTHARERCAGPIGGEA